MTQAIHMKWSALLNWQRLGIEKAEDIDPSRPPWQIDYDRLIFSSAFRRLQDKTQVFPLSGSDYVRTRLTHSLEVSTVARTLGMLAGQRILDKHGDEEIIPRPNSEPSIREKLREVLRPSDFGTIVATAALAHDLGNPPFGHSGEDAVSSWFCDTRNGGAVHAGIGVAAKLTDFKKWEGNAQGFRILTKLQLYRSRGGMRLTYVTLGAFTKYPHSSECVAKDSSLKKHGFFASEAPEFEEVAKATGLLRRPEHKGWCRHPLAYLMEAADDICYRIVDFEDGFRLGRIPYETVESLLLAIDPKTDPARLKDEPDDQSRVSYLRARAIRVLVDQVAQAFIDNEDRILAGETIRDLITLTPVGQKDGPLEAIKAVIKKRVYTAPAVLETEAAGFEIIGGLLDEFSYAVERRAAYERQIEENAANGLSIAPEINHRANKVLQLIPEEFVGPGRKPDKDPYIRLLRITDYVSGMTDSYALSLYRRLKGIALPS